jgi:ATP-dependent Lon protease
LTGEISLNGKVMPMGGIREKTMGAKCAGIQNILLPHNETTALTVDHIVDL